MYQLFEQFQDHNIVWNDEQIAYLITNINQTLYKTICKINIYKKLVKSRHVLVMFADYSACIMFNDYWQQLCNEIENKLKYIHNYIFNTNDDFTMLIYINLYYVVGVIDCLRQKSYLNEVLPYQRTLVIEYVMCSIFMQKNYQNIYKTLLLQFNNTRFLTMLRHINPVLHKNSSMVIEFIQNIIKFYENNINMIHQHIINN